MARGSSNSSPLMIHLPEPQSPFTRSLPSSKQDRHNQACYSLPPGYNTYTHLPSSGDTIPVSSSTLREALTSGALNMAHQSPLSEHTVLSEADAEVEAPPTVPVASKKAKQMIQCVRNLQHLGIENAVPELPSICVIGDQSVGKSSLIEAITGISVPRSAGCCTRCPLEINMTNTDVVERNPSTGEKWKCEIFLMKEYVFENSRYKSTKARPFGPWQPQESEELHFGSTTSKKELRDLIASAQLAILNPTENPNVFRNPQNLFRNQDRSLQVKFSPNTIRLDIYSDEVPDLSLFDLPGVISVPETEEERYLVNLVEELVKKYIKSRLSINLLALPMNNDPVNSKAANLIQRYGDKARTIGVLTKPDLIQRAESFDQWLDILEGRKFPLGHGYFVVCNLADIEVGHTIARVRERNFFKNDIWTTASLVHLQPRFGTDNLAAELQCLLEDQIRLNLPTIRTKIGERAAFLSHTLKSLPPLIDTKALIVVAQNLSDFKHGLHDLFTQSNNHDFCKTWKNISLKFRAVLHSTRPLMKAKTKAEERRARKLHEDRTPQGTPTHHNNGSKLPQVVDLGDSDLDDAHSPSGSKRKRQDPWSECRGAEYLLDDIRRITYNLAVSSIPNLINPKAIEVMNQQSVSHWGHPLSITVRQVTDLLNATINQLAREVFDPTNQGTRIFEQVTKEIRRFLGDAIEIHDRKLVELLQMELESPYTSDASGMDREKAIALQTLMTGRRNSRLSDLHAEQQQTPRKIPRIRDDELPPDEWQNEVDMLATVRAYYSIAHSRFADIVCQSIQSQLFAKCRDGLYKVLEQFFRLRTPEGEAFCEELLAEDPELASRRADLSAEIKRLESAMREIERLYSEEENDDGYEMVNAEEQDDDGVQVTDRATTHNFVRPGSSLTPEQGMQDVTPSSQNAYPRRGEK